MNFEQVTMNKLASLLLCLKHINVFIDNSKGLLLYILLQGRVQVNITQGRNVSITFEVSVSGVADAVIALADIHLEAGRCKNAEIGKKHLS